MNDSEMEIVVKRIATYIYSIWTNFMGIQHILGMAPQMAFAVALTLDIVPEPMIAWSFGDAAKGDLIGNMGRWVLGTGGKKQNVQQSQQHGQHQGNQGNQNNQGKQKQQSRPSFNPRDFRDEEDEEETQPKFQPQREMSFDGRKKHNGDGHHYVRPEFKGKMGKR